MRKVSLYSLGTNDRMHRKGTKLHYWRFGLDIRKKILYVTMVKHWNRLENTENTELYKKGLMPYSCQGSRDVYLMPSIIHVCFNIWLALKWSDTWTSSL